MNTSAPSRASSALPVTRPRVRHPRVLQLVALESRPLEPDGAASIAADDIGNAGGEQHLRRRHARGTDARDHDGDLVQPLAHDFESIQQGREHDHGRAVLVVVEDGYVESRSEAVLDLEAAWGRDVLEVDAPEDRGDRADAGDDLVDVLRGEADGPRVDAAELLEENRLALHDRQGGLGPDVAEPEHRRPVRDDCDRVLLDREVPDLRRLVRDRTADARNARRVRHGEVVARLDRALRVHLELAAEVQEERPVGDVLDLDAVERADGVDDPER